jgi:hypothetical protein
MTKAIMTAVACAAVAVGLAVPAHADRFIICPDGHEGVAGGDTSCAFARNVRQMFYATGGSHYFTAWSPTTLQSYTMSCFDGYVAHFDYGDEHLATQCYGVDSDTEVVIW